MTRDAELRRIGKQGKRIRTKRLELRIAASPVHHVRVGFIVPKYGHSSVERNHLKRQLREITRTHLLRTLPAVDIVVRALPSSYGADYTTLLTELRKSALEIEVPPS